MTCFQRLTLVAALVLSAGRCAAAEGPLSLAQAIALTGVAGKLDHLAADGKGQRLFVANKPNGTLDIVDLKTGKCIKQVADQGKVSGVAYAADLDTIYVGNGSGTCNAFSGKDYKLVFSTKLAKSDNVHYHAKSHLVYVAHGKAVSALDAKSGQVKATIPLPGSSHGFAIDEKANRIFVNLSGPCQVGVVDLTTNKLVKTYPLTLAEGNSPVAYDAQGGRLFVGCRKKPMVIVLDAASGKELTHVDIPADIDDLQFDGQRGRLYASCGAGALAVIQKKDDKYEVIGKITTPKNARTCALSSSGDRLYLAVPRQEGKDGPEIFVYQAKPANRVKEPVKRQRQSSEEQATR